jgi:hypothetical protein
MAALVCVGDRLAPAVSTPASTLQEPSAAVHAATQQVWCCLQDKLQAGTGTYIRGGFIYASIVGLQQVVNEGTEEVRLYT